MTVIAMTAHRRPEYTHEVLQSLSQCSEEIGSIPVFIYVDHGCEEVSLLCDRWQASSPLNVSVFTSAGNLGCNGNTWRALDGAFRCSDSVIMLEDDTVLAKDAIRFFLFCLDRFKHDADVFSVSGYNRADTLKLDAIRQLGRRKWFTPWGWATWKDRYDDIVEARQKVKVSPRLSWDIFVTDNARRGRQEVFPVVSRVQNIGAENGAHVPSPEWHRQNQHTPAWAGIFGDIAPGDWVLT